MTAKHTPHVVANGKERRIDDEELLADIRRVAKCVDGPLSENQYDKRGEFSRNTAKRHFGTWRDALAEAGVEDSNDGPEPNDERKILADLVSVAEELGRPPSVSEYDELGEFHSRTITRRIESDFATLAREAHQIALEGER